MTNGTPTVFSVPISEGGPTPVTDRAAGTPAVFSNGIPAVFSAPVPEGGPALGLGGGPPAVLAVCTPIPEGGCRVRAATAALARRAASPCGNTVGGGGMI